MRMGTIDTQRSLRRDATVNSINEKLANDVARKVRLLASMRRRDRSSQNGTA
jgi:hypothetical protein